MANHQPRVAKCTPKAGYTPAVVAIGELRGQARQELGVVCDDIFQAEPECPTRKRSAIDGRDATVQPTKSYKAVTRKGDGTMNPRRGRARRLLFCDTRSLGVASGRGLASVTLPPPSRNTTLAPPPVLHPGTSCAEPATVVYRTGSTLPSTGGTKETCHHQGNAPHPPPPAIGLYAILHPDERGLQQPRAWAPGTLQ